MQAVIMAGGEGRRLRPLTAVIPKPLAPVGESTILEILLHQLRHRGFEEVIACVGYRAELLMATIGDGGRFGLGVRYHKEEKPLGTVGALAEIAGWLDESFLVMNGDLCTDLDYRTFLESHRAHDRPATIGAVRREEQLELGVLEFDDDQRLVGFREKPLHRLWVAMGVNAFDRRVLELIPPGVPMGFDRLMEEMLRLRWPVEVYRHSGHWLDIGRPDDYEKLHEQLPAIRDWLLPGEGSDGQGTVRTG